MNSMLTSLSVPTQKSVAEASGISRSSVGEILSGGAASGKYSEETRQRVMTAATTLGYIPNRAAQTMRKRRSNLIGLVHFGAGIEVAEKTNLSLSRHLNASGYDCLSADMNWNGGSVERTLAELLQTRVEGVLISQIQDVITDAHIEAIRRVGIPVVSVFGELRANASLIYSNIIRSLELLTRHLLDVGHQRILQLAPDNICLDGDRSRNASHRVLGFRSGFSERGDYEIVTEEEFFRTWPQEDCGGVKGTTVKQDARLYEQVDQPVYQFCKRLFASGKLPDALVCPNDMYAMEVFAAAAEFGIRIPADMAVTGFDNDRVGAFPAYGITTVEQDIEGACSVAVKTLFENIQNPRHKTKNILFDCKLILRTSCGRMEPGSLTAE